ncbi:unnamed protein product [marine sediment metagenome]|uniref:Uncharacterized protein n=1 Tax=marine sediment metagenome TaxID=412755 RepID=X0YWN5_9ZZZZ
MKTRTTLTMHGLPPKVLIGMRDSLDSLRVNESEFYEGDKDLYICASFSNVTLFSDRFVPGKYSVREKTGVETDDVSEDEEKKFYQIATRIAESWLEDREACINNIAQTLVEGQTGFKNQDPKEVLEEYSTYLEE